VIGRRREVEKEGEQSGIVSGHDETPPPPDKVSASPSVMVCCTARVDIKDRLHPPSLCPSLSLSSLLASAY
jgi:hypothetical protein